MNTRPLDPTLKIAVVGGGTAGYLAALTLRTIHPEVQVTLIESKKIPIIGVGEATTSEIVPFLHRILGFDPAEFYHKVRPTWKLGIKFHWGAAPTSSFNYPFDRGPLMEAYRYEGEARQFSLLSALMTADRSPILSRHGSPASLLSEVPFAYHLDNERFVQYLREKSEERGIQHLDREIVDATLRSDGGGIVHLITSDGETLEYDFYVDCTGFRSSLLEKQLGSPFRSYASSLFTDSAIVANRPRVGPIKPYTTAETMDNGWCWNIPMVEEEHLGYVYSAAFCSGDEATAEMERKHPSLRDFRRVSFRSGRHEHFVIGNVAAVGNSYGFVEPLESTGIFAISRECLVLANNLAEILSDASARNFANQTIGDMWDYLRWFLAVHYRFNRHSDTSFWRECRARVDIGGAAGHLTEFVKGAPLHYGGTDTGPCGGHNFNEFGYDVLLFGQAIQARYLPPRLSREEYFRHVEEINSLASVSLEQQAGLALLAATPSLFDDLARENGWISSLAASMQQATRHCGEDNDVLTAIGIEADSPAESAEAKGAYIRFEPVK